VKVEFLSRELESMHTALSFLVRVDGGGPEPADTDKVRRRLLKKIDGQAIWLPQARGSP
jgi:hypothetical protein